jgi:serine/threonine protein phosphatase PrpC
MTSSPHPPTGNPAPPGTAIAEGRSGPPPDRREQIPVQVAAPPAAVASTFGDPLVLIGNPRLGSTPRAFTTAPESPTDSAIDGGEVAGLVVRAASLRGDDHRHYGEPRQDSFGLHVLGGKHGDILLACVADGIGSKPLSHIGSAAVCRFLAEEIEPYAARMLDPQRESNLDEWCRELVARLNARLELEAASRKVSPQSLSTTLVAALIGPVDSGRRRAVLFAVGDSPAFVLRSGGFQEPFDSGDEELAGAATAALPGLPDAVSVRVADFVPGDVVVLCTDGLGNPMRDDMVRKQLAEWWGGAPPGLPLFFWQMSFRAQSFGDDRTAVNVWVG